MCFLPLFCWSNFLSPPPLGGTMGQELGLREQRERGGKRKKEKGLYRWLLREKASHWANAPHTFILGLAVAIRGTRLAAQKMKIKCFLKLDNIIKKALKNPHLLYCTVFDISNFFCPTGFPVRIHRVYRKYHNNRP